MSDSPIPTLADLVAGALDLRVWCLWCARGNRTDPAPVMDHFRKRGWPSDLISARSHFRCPYCRQKAWMLLLPSRPPRPVPGPMDFPDLPARTYLPTPEEVEAGRAATANLVGSIYRMFRSQGKRDKVIAAGRPAAEKMAQAAMAAAAERQWIAQLRATWRPPPDLRLHVNRRIGRPSHAERLTLALAALDDRPMCNRYQVRTAHAEALQLKLGLTPDRSLNYAGEVYPGYTGLVIANGEDGALQARAMTWGFPLVLKGKQGQPLKPKPVNNAREDKLGTWMWRDSFERRRCLIPASAWAEAEGERGKMTCTWHAMPDGEPMMLAGIWRPTDEWGEAYSMVMVDGCPQMAEVHDRMPVILRPDHWVRWMAGAPTDAFPLCETWLGDLAIDRTAALWAARE